MTLRNKRSYVSNSKELYMANFPFPPADPNAWATWNVTFQPGAIGTDRDLDKATLEQSISDFAVTPDPAGITCAPEFIWKDIDGSHSQLKVNLTCKNSDGTKVLAKRIIVRPPGGTKPPPGRVSEAELVPRS